MIKHIVMWKLDESYSPEKKSEILDNMKAQLLQLEGKIEVLKSISVGLSHKDSNATNYDILLDTTFSTMDDIKTYAVHPEHVKVVEYIKSVKLERACVDYEF